MQVPAGRGFGSRLIEQVLAADIVGTVDLQFRPEGVTCRIEAPLEEGTGDEVNGSVAA